MPNRELPSISQQSFNALSEDKAKKVYEAQADLAKIQNNQAKNEIIEQYKQLHGKVATVENIYELKQLRKSAKLEIEFSKKLDDPEDIQKSNAEWYKRELAIAKDAGPNAGRRINQINNIYHTVNTQGIRIGHGKIRTKALEQLGGLINEFKYNISQPEGGVTSGLDSRTEVIAAINTYESQGIFDPITADAFRKGFGSSTAGALLTRALNENEYIQASQGIQVAKKDYDAKNELFRSLEGDLSPTEKKTWLLRKKSLNPTGSSLSPELGNAFVGAQENIIGGRGNYKNLVSTSKDLKQSLNKDIKSGNYTAAGTAAKKKQLAQVNATMRVWDSLLSTGREVSTGTSLSLSNNDILDFTKKNSEVANKLGLPTNDSSFTTFVGVRKELFNNLYVAKDQKQTAINTYNFLTNLTGQGPLVSAPELGGVGSELDNLKKLVAYESQMFALTGTRGLTKKTTALFDLLQAREDPASQEALGIIISENPELLDNVARSRAKPANQIFGSTTKEVLSKNSAVFKFKSGDVIGLAADIRNNPKARAAFDKVFQAVSINIAEELEKISKLSGEPRESLTNAIALAVYRDLVAGGNGNNIIYSGVGERSDDPINTTLEELRNSYMDALKANRTERGETIVYNDHTLARNKTNSNIVLGAFGATSKGFFGRTIDSVTKKTDIGERNLRPLDKVGQTKLETHLKMLSGNSKIDLSNRLRLLHSNGTNYQIHYVDKFNNPKPLTMKDGQPILLNSSLIDNNSEVDAKQEANYVIELIRKSNPTSGLTEGE